MTKLIVILVATVLAFAAGCSGQPTDGYVDPKLQTMHKSPALAWLRSNNNPSALATNRFGQTAAAIEFVEELLRAGAIEVYVADPYDEPERISDEGGPYADTLIVELPAIPEQRAKIFGILATEASSEGFDPPKDNGQRMELLWWD